MDLSGVRRDVVLPVRVDPEGRAGPTPHQSRGPRWRRSSKGFFVPADVDASHPDQRIVEAAAALPDDWGGITGWAALAWMGGRWFDGTPWGGGRPRPVVRAIGGNHWAREQPNLPISEERLKPGDLITVDGIRVTTAVRSVVFEMRYASSLLDAVTTVDLACYSDLVSLEEVTEYAAGLRGWTGIPLCRDSMALGQENAWSPREVLMRLVWQEVRPVELLCNVPVFSLEGDLLGAPDLLDPVSGVMGEYEGEIHFVDGQRRAVDLDREELLRRHGLEPTAMVRGDLADLSRFTSRLRSAYERAERRPAADRRWTVERPHQWIDTSTVAARRMLSHADRARLLRNRAA